MKRLLLLPLLLLCMAATTLAADFQMTGIWMVTAGDLSVGRVEFYKDGRVVIGEKNSTEIFLESTYRMEQSKDGKFVYLIMDFPEKVRQKMPADMNVRMRVNAKILSQHSLSLLSFEAIDENGIVKESEEFEDKNVVITRRQ